MKMKELSKALEKDHDVILKVTGFVWDEFELDQGMLLRVFAGEFMSADECWEFPYNFAEFKNYNRPFAKHDWRDSLSVPRQTAEESGAWKDPTGTLYLSPEDDEEIPFELVSMSDLAKFLKESTKCMSDFIYKMPRFTKTQVSLESQVSFLQEVATKLGLFDAADLVEKYKPSLSLKDEAYGVFTKRSRGDKPKLVKLLGDGKLHHLEEDAIKLKETLEKEFSVDLEVRKLLVEITDEVINEVVSS